jgi:hypothetical protein
MTETLVVKTIRRNVTTPLHATIEQGLVLFSKLYQEELLAQAGCDFENVEVTAEFIRSWFAAVISPGMAGGK